MDLNHRPTAYESAALPLSYTAASGVRSFGFLEGPVGIEPTTSCLKGNCSTAELRALEMNEVERDFTFLNDDEHRIIDTGPHQIL